MSVPGGARMTQIDILLSVLAVKIYVMRCLPQMLRARHAGVSIRNVKTARIASIPICISLRYIRKRLLLALIRSLYASCATILWWTLLSSIHSALGSKCRWYECWWSCWATLLTSKSLGKPASLWSKWKSSSLWCGEIRKTPPHVLWWASTETSSATSASLCAAASLALLKPLGLKSLVASSRITRIERHCVQLRNDLMHCAVRGLLIGFDVRKLLRVALRCSSRCRCSHQLTLVRQRSKMVGNRFCDQLLTIVMSSSSVAKAPNAFWYGSAGAYPWWPAVGAVAFSLR